MHLRVLCGLAGLLAVAGCSLIPSGFRFGTVVQPPPRSYMPTPERPPGAYDPYPVTPPFGRPEARLLPMPPPHRPEYVPLTAPTDDSLWLAGHWFWEDGPFWDGARWHQPTGWVWAEGRWIEPPCPQLTLEQAAQAPLGSGVRWVEAHWRCALEAVACVCPKPDKATARLGSAVGGLPAPRF
jgi:hypothetical protein